MEVCHHCTTMFSNIDLVTQKTAWRNWFVINCTQISGWSSVYLLSSELVGRGRLSVGKDCISYNDFNPYTTSSVLEETHTQGKLMELAQHLLVASSEELWLWKFWSFSHQLLASAQGWGKSHPRPNIKILHPCHPPKGTSGITRQLRMKCQPAGMLQETWRNDS